MSYCFPSSCSQKPLSVHKKIPYIQDVFKKVLFPKLSDFLTEFPPKFSDPKQLRTLIFFLLLPLEDFRSPNPDQSKHIGWMPRDFLSATCEKYSLDPQIITAYKKSENFLNFRDKISNLPKSFEEYNNSDQIFGKIVDENIPVDLVLCIWKLAILKAVFALSSEQKLSETVSQIETWILDYCREKYAGYAPVFQRPDQLAVMSCWSLSSLAPSMLLVQSIGSGCSAPAFFAAPSLTWVAGSIFFTVFAFLPMTYYLYRSGTCRACACHKCCDCSIWGPCHRGKSKPTKGLNIQDGKVYGSIVTEQPKAQLDDNFLGFPDHELKELLFRIGERYFQIPDVTRSRVMEKIYCIVLGPSCCCLELVCPGVDRY